MKDFKPDNILLLWLGKIGDFVVSTPFINAVRKKYPDSKISVMVRPPVDKLAVLADGVDDIIIFPKGAKSFRELHVFISKLLFTRWDMCIDLNPSYSGSSGRVTRFSGAKYKIGFANERDTSFYSHIVDKAGKDEHMLDRYARLADFIGLDYDKEMHLRIRDGDYCDAEDKINSLGLKNSKFISIHPGNLKKDDCCWPKANFVRLSKQIAENYPDIYQVYLTGPGEEQEILEMVEQIGEKAIFAGLMNLTTTVAFLKKTSLVIVNSTGTLHIAEAVGTPTLSFHKEYSYQCWRPFSEVSIPLSSGTWTNVSDLEYDLVWESFQKIINKLW